MKRLFDIETACENGSYKVETESCVPNPIVQL